VTHTLGVAVIVGALWGLGWGAYQSVDWALATDVLPRPEKADGATSFARYMGIWSLASTLPQVAAPAIGPLIQLVNDHAARGGYTLMFCLVFVYFLLGAVLVRNVRTTT
jgi:MFS family permease